MSDAPPQYRYWCGYPGAYREIRSSALLSGFGCISAFLLPALAGAASYALILTEEVTWYYVLGELACLAFLVWFSWWTVDHYRDVSNPAISPYFSERIEDIDTYCNGHELARNWQLLDGLATQKGASALSTFGFNDDNRGQTLIWHDPEKGLESFRAALAGLEVQSEPPAACDQLINELKLVVTALEKAQAKGAQFCLVILVSSYTCGMEHEQRKGSFF